MFVEVAVLTISVLNIVVVSTLLIVLMRYLKANKTAMPRRTTGPNNIMAICWSGLKG